MAPSVKTFAPLMLLIAVAAILPGCVTTQSSLAPPPQAVAEVKPSVAEVNSNIVFVADGSADIHYLWKTLTEVACETSATFEVKRVRWTHGTGRVFSDLYSTAHHREQGQILAQEIIEYRQNHPSARISLIGYSSGACIALATAECLPPATVDRIVLISAAISSHHDLRPALRASREGIDSFHSKRDVVCLLLYAFGTCDGLGSAVAGRYGFDPVCACQEDETLYQGLRQHAWQGTENWSGHHGRHFDAPHAEFVRDQLLPILLGCR